LTNFVDWLAAAERDDPPPVGLPLGWALVEMLGRHLLGDTDTLPGVSADSVWDVLAQLDGRPAGTEPSIDLDPSVPLRLPAPWLRRWSPGDEFTAWLSTGRVVVRPLGAAFAVADVPVPVEERPADRRVDSERERLERIAGHEIRLEVVTDPAGDLLPNPARRWADTVGDFVHWLLATRGISSSSLRRQGLFAVTNTHVDVVLDLADADPAVRLAGLDRDPGWLPDLGRIVLFHYLERPFR
jgi:hypothetical protein